jgi:hypothetical protein
LGGGIKTKDEILKLVQDDKIKEEKGKIHPNPPLRKEGIN